VWFCGSGSGGKREEEWWRGEKVDVERARKEGGVEDDRCCGGCRRVRWEREDRVVEAVEC
jgi:hypothetical protein